MENHDDVTRNHHHHQPPASSFLQSPQASSYNPLLQQGNQQLKTIWCKQAETIGDFKTHQLPLARIKKIMKSDRDVRMIAAEAPIVFAKACEMFILDLTTRSWLHAEENKRRTLQKSDMSAAVSRNFAFDFLLDVLPRGDSVTAVDPGFMAVPHHPEGGVPYYYPQGVVDGSGMYVPQPLQPWPGAWQQAVAGDGEDEAEQSEGNSGGRN